jgi:phenylalanyl-tRNA synthetase beta chain
MLVIADDEKILSLAGIIGGESSKIDQNTKKIILEVGHFNHENISITAQKLNIHTESKMRFEGKIDDNMDIVPTVMQYLGNIQQGMHLTGTKNITTENITISIAKIQQYFGFKPIELIDTLKALQMQPKQLNEDQIEITVPSWKAEDLNHDQDIMEEIFRIKYIEELNNYTQDNTKITYKYFDNIYSAAIGQKSIWNKIRDLMTARGFDEVITMSFNEKNHSDIAAFWNLDEKDIKIKNPVSGLHYMRNNLIFNLLEILINNANKQNTNLSIFEVGPIYNRTFSTLQADAVCGVRSGYAIQHNIHQEKRYWDFYDIRDDLLNLLAILGLSNNIIDYNLIKTIPHHYQDGIGLNIGKTTIAYCGQLKACEDVKEPMFAFELLLDAIPAKYFNEKKITKLQMSELHPVIRDFAFIVDLNLAVGDIIKSILNLKHPNITNVEVFDVYIKNDKKSIALRIKLESNDRFTDTIINNISTTIIDMMVKQYNAILRDH